MIDLLLDLRQAVQDHGGTLPAAQAAAYLAQYRARLKQAEVECPPPEPTTRPGQRGRPKRSKSRNLLERLLNFEQETLRFMSDADVPFTNNQGENDIREDLTPSENRRLLSLPGRRRHLLPGTQLFVDLPQKQRLGIGGLEPAFRWQIA